MKDDIFKTPAAQLAFASSLAAALGPGWAPKQNPEYSAWIRLEGGELGDLALSIQHNDGKLHVSGIFPPSQAISAPRGQHSITVTPTRPFPALAADITRRLLPDYQAALTKYRGELAAAADFEQRSMDLAARLANVADVRLRTRQSGRSNGAGIAEIDTFPAFSLAGADITVSGNSVRFEHFSVSNVEAAEAIIRILAGLKS